MNNACPTCGAVYAVAVKDIGRKIKCKKCHTALLVDDTGLVLDVPVATATAPPPPRDRDNADDFDTGDEATVAKKKAKKYADRGPPGPGLGEYIAKVGGVPTVLFVLGTFFVIYFFFQSTLSQASASRAEGAYERLKLEHTQKTRKLQQELKRLEEDVIAKNITQEKAEERAKEIGKEKVKIDKDFAPKYDEAEDDKEYAKIGAKRSPLLDNFGLMVGFILLAFGCIGHIRSDGALVLRIVAASILTAMMLAVFAKFSGCAR